MYSTQAYIYQQITRVLTIDTGDGETFIYRYNPVYAKKLTINKGIDNVLLFQFINQEEKPVNITGSDFMFRVINTIGDEILIEKPLVILNAQTGRAKVTIPGSELLSVLAQPANYSITRASGNLNEAVFTNAQSGARAPVEIVDSVLPQYVPSFPLTIPTVKSAAVGDYDGASFANYPTSSDYYWGGNPNGANYWNSFLNTEFYSSFIKPQGSITTIQMDLVGYTGTIKAQAAQDYESVPYNVTESRTYLNHTGTVYMNVIGWYPIVRLCFNNSIFSVPDQPGIPALAYAICDNGVVVDIVVTNGGSGYLAPPKISIIGDGSGATAEATLGGDGSIESITVTHGGSGYWVVPNAGVNTPYYPVSPNQQGALVIISTGFVENLYYR
jgi:BppU N-terminal domain